MARVVEFVTLIFGTFRIFIIGVVKFPSVERSGGGAAEEKNEGSVLVCELIRERNNCATINYNPRRFVFNNYHLILFENSDRKPTTVYK